MRDSCMIYRNQAEALRELPAEQFKAAVVALWDYELNDIIPEGDPITIAVFRMAQPLIDKRNRNYENGLRGGRRKNRTETELEPNLNRTITEPEPNDNQTEPNHNLKDKGERIKDKDIKDIGGKRAVFHPPTLQEVTDYVSEKGYNISPERFVDFYESKGWMIGKNKMKDWKAAVRNWSRSQRQEKTTEGRQEKNRFNNFPQRKYDFDELEKRLLRG